MRSVSTISDTPPSLPATWIDNPPPDDAWLARATPEPVLEPDLPIVDAHHHFWESRPWPYGIDDYRADAGLGHDVGQSICVEGGSFHRTTGPIALRGVGEVEAVRAASACASGRPRVAAAIVAAADPTATGDFDLVLDALDAAGGGRLSGIRYSVASHPDPSYRGRFAARPPGLLSAPEVARVAAMLGERGLLFETWLLQHQIGEAERLAAACPTTTIVIDHLGGPLGAGRYREDPDAAAAWRESLARLAERPNVRLKLGGLGMVSLGARFREQATPPSSETLAASWACRILPAISLFGPERCMFESNFPVDRGQTGWVALWNAFKRVVAHLPLSARCDLFAGTARRTYRLADAEDRTLYDRGQRIANDPANPALIPPSAQVSRNVAGDRFSANALCAPSLEGRNAS